VHGQLQPAVHGCSLQSAVDAKVSWPPPAPPRLAACACLHASWRRRWRLRCVRAAAAAVRASSTLRKHSLW